MKKRSQIVGILCLFVVIWTKTLREGEYEMEKKKTQKESEDDGTSPENTKSWYVDHQDVEEVS